MKKRVMILIGVILLLVFLVVGVLIVTKKDKDKQSSEKIEGPVPEKIVSEVKDFFDDYGDGTLNVDEFNEKSEQEVPNDSYVIGKDSWLFNIMAYDLEPTEENKKFTEIEQELSESVPKELKSDDPLIFDRSFIDDNGSYVVIYRYKGVNLMKYQFDVSDLSAMISDDLQKIVYKDPVENPLSINQLQNYNAKCYIRAMTLLEDYYDDYKETEEREIMVQMKLENGNWTVVNGNAVMEDMKGLNAKSVWGENDPNYYANVFLPREKARVRQIYQKAIETGKYNPNNPLDVK